MGGHATGDDPLPTFSAEVRAHDETRLPHLHSEEEITELTLTHETSLIAKFIEHYSDTILHPNHYLILLAKRNHVFLCRKMMIQLIATLKETSPEAEEMKKMLKKQCDMYKSHLEVLEKINCGSRC